MIKNNRFLKTLVRKTPDSTRTITINWSRFARLLGSGVTISTVAWTSDDGINLASASLSSNVATVDVSSGTAGQTYRVTAKATASDGQIEEQTGLVEVVKYKGTTGR